MDTYLQWTLVLFVLALLAAGCAWLVRAYLTGTSPSGLFGPRGERRLGVVESVSIDTKRRLVLVRRDDREHLILTGGPTDLVIETGIAASEGTRAAH